MYKTVTREGYELYLEEKYQIESVTYQTEGGYKICINREDAPFFLSMQINRPLNFHEDEESFLDWTAKELAIRIIYELDEEEGYKLFKMQQEPLATRVFHYLTQLRDIT